MTRDDQLVNVFVDLPHHWATGGESMWARPLGGELFEIRNVPFHAYGLNLLDVVRAVEPSPETKPVVVAVVRASGHRTLRVFFSEAVPEPERAELLRQLNRHRAYFEGATSGYFAIDVGPGGDYDAVRAQLDAWQAEGLLDYETCEARTPGSFDDLPDQDGT